MNEREMRQAYLNYFIIAQNLVEQLKNSPAIWQDSLFLQSVGELQQLLKLDATPQTLSLLSNHIVKLQEWIPKNQQAENEVEGRTSSYVKVKKSGNAYYPEEQAQDIEVPEFTPIPIHRNSLRHDPDYIFKDQAIRVPVSSSNRGSSHILMFAFLTFFFETLFLLLSFVLYQG